MSHYNTPFLILTLACEWHAAKMPFPATWEKSPQRAVCQAIGRAIALALLQDMFDLQPDLH